MKSAHKLVAALAIFILLSVAAYFIITGLQEASSKPQIPKTSPESVSNTTSQGRVAASSAPVPEAVVEQSTVGHEVNSVSTVGGPASSDTSPISSTTTTAATTITTTTTTAVPTSKPTTTSSTILTPETTNDGLITTTPSPSPSPPSTTTTTTTSSQPLASLVSSTITSTRAEEEDIFITTQKIYRDAFQRIQAPIDLSPDEVDKWQQFKSKYMKAYSSSQEEELRRSNFIGNLRFIETFNRRGQSLFKLDVNRFADMNQDEINNLFIGPKQSWAHTSVTPPQMRILSDNDVQSSDLARSVDWRNLTANDGPVNQDSCRDSSIFAIVASLECTLNAAGGTKTKLSEQQIIDCLAYNAPPQWPQVCSGQIPMTDIIDLLQQKAIAFATAQEYGQFKQAQAAGQAPQRQCVLPPEFTPDSRPHLGSYVTVPRDNIDEALINSSPLVVTIDASQPTFHFYKSGIYHDLGCSTDSYNYHALLVAYSPAATDQDAQAPIYTIRASLGRDWGELGHMRLLKDPQKNKCLPQDLAIYPNIALE